VIRDQLIAGCGQNTSLEIQELQLEGKKRSTAKDFIHGYQPKQSEKLGA
jgi:methionyl-tRNA formyltransferase